jgi:hypothetical protein
MAFRSSPPRSIDLYSRLILLFSGFESMFGWIFFGFGMIFFWIFTFNSTAMLWFSTSKNWVEYKAEVIQAKMTNSSENEEEVFELNYAYFFDEEKYVGRSYFTGDKYEEGDFIAIQYNEENIAQSRMIGGRSKIFGWWAIFVIIFPLTGIGFIMYSLRKNTKSLYLIKNGHFTTGTMQSKEATGGVITINNNSFPIYNYKFEFQYNERTFISKCRTHLSELVEDEVNEFILFDQKNPELNQVYDAIPNALTFDNMGYMNSLSIRKAHILIAPFLSMAIHLPLIWLFMMT